MAGDYSDAFSLSWSRYKSKFSIILLLYLISPSPPSRAPSALSTLDLETETIRESGFGTLQADETDRIEIPLTPPYESETFTERIKGLEELKTSMAVKGSTSKEPTISEWTTTPSLSDPPSPEPTHNEPKIEELGPSGAEDDPEDDSIDSKSSDSSPPPDPIPKPTKLPFLTPTTYTILLLHLIYHLQYHLVNCGDRLSQVLLSNPLPPPFKVPITRPSSSKLSLSKRLSRLNWRFRLIRKRCGGTLIEQGIPWVLIFPIFVNGLQDTIFGGEGEGWNAVIGREGGFRVFDLRWYSNPAIRSSARWLEPLRVFVLLEVLSTVLIYLVSLSPILISLDLLPSSLFVPKSMLPAPPPMVASLSSGQVIPLSQFQLPPRLAKIARTRPPMIVPTTYLLPHYLSLALDGISTLQIVLLLITRPASYRILSLTTIVLFVSIVCSYGNLVDTREEVCEDVKKVSIVIDRFKWRGPSQGGVVDFPCWICFEEEFEPHHVINNFKTRCQLPRCGHQIHASCLASWFKRQSFCPACHTRIPIPSSHATL